MYDEIVNKYYKTIRRYCCCKLNGNEAAADDVTQEVFLALYKKLHKLKLSENIKLWLFRAADYEIKTYIRKNPSFVPIDECTTLISEDTYNLDEPFECLSREETSLLYEYYVSGDSRETVAKSHNISTNALYVRVHKIRNKLAEYLKIDTKSRV